MATEPLLRALARMRGHLLDPETLVRAVASGAQRGGRVPAVAGRPVRRVELRYVDLKAGRHLQVTSYDDTQAHTTNVAVGDAAKAAVDDLLDEPFGSWHVDTTTQTHQVRATKKLEAVTHTQDRATPVEAERGHDKAKQRLLAEDDPVLRALGISDAQGRIKPTRQAKYRQVEEFLRLLDAAIGDALAKGQLRTPDRGRPAACRRPRVRQRLPDVRRPPLPPAVRGLPVRVTGVDVKQQSADHNSTVARARDRGRLRGRHHRRRRAAPAPRRGAGPARLRHRHRRRAGPGHRVGRRAGAGRSVLPPRRGRAAAHGARRPAPYAMLTRHGILRERFADTLTDALRAASCGWSATASTSWSSWRASTRPATRCCAPPAPARPSPAAGSARSTTTW